VPITCPSSNSHLANTMKSSPLMFFYLLRMCTCSALAPAAACAHVLFRLCFPLLSAPQRLVTSKNPPPSKFSRSTIWVWLLHAALASVLFGFVLVQGRVLPRTRTALEICKRLVDRRRLRRRHLHFGTAACYRRATAGSSYDDFHPDNSALFTGIVFPHSDFAENIFFISS